MSLKYNRHLELRAVAKMPTMIQLPQGVGGPDSTTAAAVAAKTGLAALAGVVSFFSGFTTQLFWCVLGLLVCDAGLGCVVAIKTRKQLSFTKLMHTLVKVLTYAFGFAAAALAALVVVEIGLVFNLDLSSAAEPIPWVALALYAVNDLISIGSHLRTLKSPIAGLIEEAAERAGDVVERGRGEK